MKPHTSYYDILKISSDASDADVKRAYHELAKIYHPDLNPQNRSMAEHRFRLLNEAYMQLRTHKNRQAYNQSMRLTANNDNRSTHGFLAQIGEIFWPKNNAKEF